MLRPVLTVGWECDYRADSRRVDTLQHSHQVAIHIGGHSRLLRDMNECLDEQDVRQTEEIRIWRTAGG